jgi:hypothetical protein
MANLYTIKQEFLSKLANIQLITSSVLQQWKKLTFDHLGNIATPIPMDHKMPFLEKWRNETRLGIEPSFSFTYSTI